ncbi:M48 family metallopeptidase [Acuticoccus mangrovi]|uniref:M48 family metallopeptidase n=1 Tax=Acuticoccus mangrovi TaxID=2796142 RepID=A0A934IQK1_9HYPH|nr:SprT family zinc-dependent metalloprotease [Acuticoccus mangrovi]MBJ3776870.1 M48 family metallopeptidase [Acuticoccus mangrovi]
MMGVKRRARLFRAAPAEREQIVTGSPEARVVVDVRRSATAKRMTLRIPPGHANPVVTAPLRAHLSTVERFVESQEGWLAARLAERAPALPFADGCSIPLRGELHRIVWVGGNRGTVRLGLAPTGPTIEVLGRPEHLGRRVGDFLRRNARADIDAAVSEFAARVGRKPSALRIKDTRAQWGSCTPTGVLSFSWRLVLAPPFVLRYVAAHEVAHLVELNHSPAFWRLNAELDPHYERARAWLKGHGRMLHAVGVEAPPAS